MGKRMTLPRTLTRISSGGQDHLIHWRSHVHDNVGALCKGPWRNRLHYYRTLRRLALAGYNTHQRQHASRLSFLNLVLSAYL